MKFIANMTDRFTAFTSEKTVAKRTTDVAINGIKGDRQIKKT